MKKKWMSYLSKSLFLIFLNLPYAGFAFNSQNKSTPSYINLGSSTALEGPARLLGQQMTLGAQIYLDKLNDLGGINGQKLKLIVYNDNYEPEFTSNNIRRLITKDKVIAIIGNAGAPNAVVAIPIVNELKTLLYASFTGLDKLYKSPPDRYVFNFRASHAEETTALIQGLLQAGVKPYEMAFFTENDALGNSGYKQAIKVLKESGYTDADKLVHTRFTRNTLNIEDGLAEILDIKKPPKVIIIVAPYKPAARFIKLAIPDLPNTLFVNLAFVGSDALVKELGTVGNGKVIVTQVVPSFESDLPGIKEYKENLARYAKGSQPGFISLEGYLATKLFGLALQRAAKLHKVTREGIIDVLESMQHVDIGIGIPISFSKNNHQALHQVWPTLLKNGKFVSFEWTELTPLLKE